jgi:hypothetical protein
LTGYFGRLGGIGRSSWSPSTRRVIMAGEPAELELIAAGHGLIQP